MQLLMLIGAAAAFVPPTTRQHLVLHATTPSGIVYEDIEIGEGKTANAGDYVSVIYETRLNGKVIDATGGGEAKVMSTGVQGAGDRPWAQFAVGKGKVIKGWDETVQTMRVGGKRKLTLPAELAYGDEGSPDGVIPPGADLNFDVQLLRIKRAAGGQLLEMGKPLPADDKGVEGMEGELPVALSSGHSSEELAPLWADALRAERPNVEGREATLPPKVEEALLDVRQALGTL